MDLNKTMLIGRLAQEAELRSLPTGRSVLSFAVATNRYWKDATGEKKKQAEFHRVVAWGKLAETVSQYLGKGRQVYIEGRLHTRDWTGEDGLKRYRSEIVADHVILLGNKPAQITVTTLPEEDTGEVVEEEVKVEDLPF